MTLVELMISMVLGLVVVGAVISMLLANKRSYATTEALSQVQESSRSAFELLARDVRQIGATGCDRTNRVANVLSGGTAWWRPWFGVFGYDGAQADPGVTTGTAVGQRVAGTDSLQIQSLDGAGLSITSHTPALAEVRVNAASTPFVAGDVLMLCDFDHAALFRVTGYNSATVTVTHNDVAGTPGNCSKGLGYPTLCTSTGNVYQFAPNSQIARLGATDWYIGNNGRVAEGGRSLYRKRLTAGGVVATEEVVAGITDLQVRYRLAGAADFVEASTMSAGDWPNVNALTITLTTLSADQNASTNTTVNSGRIRRQFTNLVTLRNRVP
jgi:type IV pilus assembly protein PilW